MFYEKENHNVLRFGDVLEGFILSSTSIISPEETKKKREYHIKVKNPDYVVVLSPCCSIGDKTLALSPLLSVIPGFFNNPFLSEDLTRINRKMTPQQSVPPHVWQTMSPTDKACRFKGVREAYAFVENFVYEKHDLLKTYTVHRQAGNIESNYYMLDFRRIYRIECDKVANPTQAPLETKILELLIQIRKELRDKLTWYFGRIPEEDQI
jgi:hypothetical protein